MTNIIAVNPEGLESSNVGKVLPLVKEDGPVLHSIASEVQLVDQETSRAFTMQDARCKRSRGIAAPQVGETYVHY